jgi:bifunctional DNA-binding transcriptional regulator/antitoxin component of YhaV-PrlF toxin-antitoxin module
MAMSFVEVDSRYRVTLTRDVRRLVGVRKGQSVYIVPKGGAFVVIPLKEDIDAELHKLIGNVKFGKAARRKAGAFLLKQAR